jgi:hypothetical protein
VAFGIGIDKEGLARPSLAYSGKIRRKSGNRAIKKALQIRAKSLIINGFAASFGPQGKVNSSRFFH